MEAVVLDSSVIVKSVLKPGRWLSEDVYRREEETHAKARKLIDLLNRKKYTVLLPFPVLVEVGAVISRFTNREVAESLVVSLKSTKNYLIVNEENIREEALNVALDTGSSGFDAYIIAAALRYHALLVTDDVQMCRHAEKVMVRCVLLREVSFDYLINLF